MPKFIYTLNQQGKRQNIEDSISGTKAHSNNVFIVCDGVGGNNSGEVASAKAVEAFTIEFAKSAKQITNLKMFKESIERGLQLFVKNLNAFIQENPSAENASTTLTLVLLKEKTAFIAWCGDSKIMHVRGGEVVYETSDHSLVQQLFEQGIITRNEMLHHPQKNVILKSLNIKTTAADIETAELNTLQAQDWILQCTDGIMEQFGYHEIKSVLSKFDKTKDYAAAVDHFCKGKTHDNYSMILQNLQIGKTKFPIFWILAIPILIALAAFLFLNKNKEKSGNTLPTEIAPVVNNNNSSFKGISGDKPRQDSANRSSQSTTSATLDFKKPTPEPTSKAKHKDSAKNSAQ